MVLGISCILWIIHVVQATEIFRISTYNTALTPMVSEYQTRRHLIGSALSHIQSDVICLQEVWYSNDIATILDHVTGNRYPHSFSGLHDDKDQLSEVSTFAAPCLTNSFVLRFLPCIKLTCGETSSRHENIKCTQRCGLLRLLPQECITCLVLSKPEDVSSSCLENLGTRYNAPGLLLLSNRPLKNARVVRYDRGDKKLFIPRSYITAEIDGIGTIVCTHTSANLGNEYFEDLPYDSWESQNLDEAQTLVSVLQAVPKAIILGDLNSSPEVKFTNVSADMTAGFNYLRSHGYQSAYVDRLGICTWCTYNPLAYGQQNNILDHVMIKGLTVIGTERIMDDNIPGQVFPYSDHYGIRVTVIIEEE